MNWNWPFAKSSPEQKSASQMAWPLVALSEPRAASWGSREAGALTRDGYLKNAVAYRCVRMVAEAAASIPLKSAHEGVSRLMRQPMPEAATAGFLEAVYTELLLTGNAFVEAVRLPGETDVAALYPIRTVRVRPVKDASGWVVAWARVSGLETGLALLWRAAGIGEAAELVFENRAGLAWRPVRLAAPEGSVHWARRGADVPDNWDLPDPASAARYAVEADYGAGFGERTETGQGQAEWPEGAIAVRIAEIGTDGRIGEWLSIPAGSPYL